MQVSASLLGPKLLRAARPTPESSLLSCAGREAQDRNVPGAGRTGRRRLGQMPSSSAQPPGSLLFPPYTHPEVKSCCTLSSRSRRVSSISATASPPLGFQTAAAALGPPHLALARHDHSQPAPPRLRVRPRPSTAAPSASAPPPTRALSPRPSPACAAAVSRAGLRPQKRGGASLPAENPGVSSLFTISIPAPLVFLFKMKVVS